jgi:hypothetical protein
MTDRNELVDWLVLHGEFAIGQRSCRDALFSALRGIQLTCHARKKKKDPFKIVTMNKFVMLIHRGRMLWKLSTACSVP